MGCASRVERGGCERWAGRSSLALLAGGRSRSRSPRQLFFDGAHDRRGVYVHLLRTRGSRYRWEGLAGVFSTSKNKARKVMDGRRGGVDEHVLLALPRDVPDAHGAYDEFPVAREHARGEKFHEGRLRLALHEDAVREVFSERADDDLHQDEGRTLSFRASRVYAERQQQRTVDRTTAFILCAHVDDSSITLTL